MASIASYNNPKTLDSYELLQDTGLKLRDERTEDFPYMQRIAIVGKMHAGKSTLAKVLSSHGFTSVALADEVKTLGVSAANLVHIHPSFFYPRQITPITREDLDKNKSRYRGLLQWIGTYGREAISADIWIKIFEQKYLQSGSQTRYVVDDMRFPNEANALRTKGFAIVKVERDEKQRKESIAKDYKRQHGKDIPKKVLKEFMNADSEVFVDDIKPDIIIKNNYTVAALQNAGLRLINKTTRYGY